MRARISVSDALGRLEQAGGEQVLFAAVDVDQLDRGGVVAAVAAVEPEPGDPALGLLAALLQVGDPLAAALGPLDPGDEARHHPLQLGQDHAAVLARLRQRRGHQPQDQLLVGLAGGVDADVAERRRRQQAAQQVQRLGPDRAPPGALGLAVAARPALRRPVLDLLQRARVDPEQLVHRAPELGAELVVAVEAVAAAGHRLVVGDVAGRLLQVGGEAAALEQLGEDVGDPLAGDVGAADLGDRVVAVADEDALVELRGPGALLVVEGAPARRRVGRELLEKEPPDRPGIPRIAGKKRPFDGLRQVDEGEYGPVEVGEVGSEDRSLLGAEFLDRVAHSAHRSGGRRRAALTRIGSAGSQPWAYLHFDDCHEPPIPSPIGRRPIGAGLLVAGLVAIAAGLLAPLLLGSFSEHQEMVLAVVEAPLPAGRRGRRRCCWRGGCRPATRRSGRSPGATS